MLERNRRAAAPDHLQHQYAHDALTKARDTIAAMDAPAAEAYQDRQPTFQEKVSRAVDRYYDDRQSPAAEIARQSAVIKKRAHEVRSELLQLMTALEAALARDDVPSLIEAREKVDSASVSLGLLVGA